MFVQCTCTDSARSYIDRALKQNETLYGEFHSPCGDHLDHGALRHSLFYLDDELELSTNMSCVIDSKPNVCYCAINPMVWSID